MAVVEDRARGYLTAFPDRRIRALNWVEDGDTVVVECEWNGTHNGPLTLRDGSQLSATGQRCVFRLVSVIQVNDGKTVAHRTYWDQLPAMMQLGLVAPTKG